MTPADQLARIKADAATALREALERIKAGPELCSRFLGACARLRALEKEVRLAAQGSWKLASRCLGSSSTKAACRVS